MSDTATAPLFTTENAREMQARAVEARRRNAELREAERLAALVAAQTAPPASDYVAARLMRVREHIARVDGELAKASEALDIERLARALAALAELERVLDGRPLPGSRRPGKERAERRAELEPM